MTGACIRVAIWLAIWVISVAIGEAIWATIPPHAVGEGEPCARNGSRGADDGAWTRDDALGGAGGISRAGGGGGNRGPPAGGGEFLPPPLGTRLTLMK